LLFILVFSSNFRMKTSGKITTYTNFKLWRYSQVVDYQQILNQGRCQNVVRAPSTWICLFHFCRHLVQTYVSRYTCLGRDFIFPLARTLTPCTIFSWCLCQHFCKTNPRSPVPTAWVKPVQIDYRAARKILTTYTCQERTFQIRVRYYTVFLYDILVYNLLQKFDNEDFRVELICEHRCWQWIPSLSESGGRQVSRIDRFHSIDAERLHTVRV